MTRVLSRLLLSLLVLAVLVVAADRGAAVLAGRAVAQRLQQTHRTASTPTVTFRGVPFLTQAVTGRYTTVDVGMLNVPSTNGLILQRLDVTLDGVHAPLRQVLNGGLTSLAVEHADAAAHVTFGALENSANTKLSGQGVTVALGRAAADRVVVTASVSTLLGRFTVSGQARVSASQGRVLVTLVPQSLSGIPQGLRDFAAQQINVSALAPALPFQLSIRSVTVDATGLQLTATGSNFTVS